MPLTNVVSFNKCLLYISVNLVTYFEVACIFPRYLNEMMITFANHRIIENWNYFQSRFYKIICLRMQTPGLRVVAFEYCTEAYSGSYKLMPSNVKQCMLIQWPMRVENCWHISHIQICNLTSVSLKMLI